MQELVSRLTKTPITTFNSAVNSTIVTNPVLFPLNQSIYVDASHDSVMATSTLFTMMHSEQEDSLSISLRRDELHQSGGKWPVAH